MARRGLQCNAPGGEGPPAGNGAHGPRVPKPAGRQDVTARVPQLVRAPASAETQRRPTSRPDREGAPEMSEQKPEPRVKWSTRRIITLVILLLILALVIYLKATGGV